MAELLVAHGAQINPVGTDPPLLGAAHGKVKLMTFLLLHGANPNARDSRGSSALDSAARSDYYAACADLLLQSGADPNARSPEGQTALHWAAAQGATKVVTLLLAYKADVNAANKYGSTPLHDALRYGGPGAGKAAEVLIQHGAH
jgi:ankyrin repeat protein